MKNPSTNIQAPEKLQTSSFKQPGLLVACLWMFGVWNFSGAWCLEFGVSET
jgi:hypothetical protein